MPYYTGVGSRSTPTTVLQTMEQIAASLHDRGWRLRSGGADGADQAFGRGARDRADIYVPWRGFGHAERGARVVELADDWRLYDEHVRLLELAAPHLATLPETRQDGTKINVQAVTKLHARNVLQVVGDTPGQHSNDPSRCLVCWTPGGREQGGTATAIRIARHLGVPVFNLAIDGALPQLAQLIHQGPARPKPTPTLEVTVHKIEVANLRDLPELDPSLGHHYIGRASARDTNGPSSQLYNRWSHRHGTRADHVVGSRADAIACYRRWLWDDNLKPWLSGAEPTPAAAEVLDLARKHVDGDQLTLVCWCKPQPCHGDVVRSAIEWLVRECPERI